MDTSEKVKSRWTRSFFTALNTRADEERYICEICQKDFVNPSNLTLHSQVHVIERKFKCESCQVSFHSQGHLQKHKRSSAHETRVQMTQAFGVPTSDNPRPYGCPECDTAFRKHGHLAKHLRSKSHITRLESNGLIPVGTYAALEKCGQELKDKLVTTNSEQSLQSIRQIAMQLFNLQPISNEPPPSYHTGPDMMYNTGPSGPMHPSSSMSVHQSPLLSLPPQQHQPPPPQPPQQIPNGTYFAPTPTTSTPPLQRPLQRHPSPLPPPPPPPPPPQQQQQQTTSQQVPVTVHGSNILMTQQIHHHQFQPAHPLLPQQQPPHMGVCFNEDPSSQMMLSMMPHQLQPQSLDYTMRRQHHYQ